MAELARQLDAWAGLFDGAAAPVISSSLLDPQPAERLRRECQTLLARGASAASTVDVDGAPFSLHTIGPGGALRGVLAIGSAALDEQARSVVTTVVAMTGFALEQTQALTQARGSLRAGVVRALIAGDTALARDVGSAAWGGLPADPVTVAATTPPPDALEGFLELRAAREQGGLFFGRDPEGGLAIALPADASFSLKELAERFGLSIGVADPAPSTRSPTRSARRGWLADGRPASRASRRSPRADS